MHPLALLTAPEVAAATAALRLVLESSLEQKDPESKAMSLRWIGELKAHTGESEHRPYPPHASSSSWYCALARPGIFVFASCNNPEVSLEEPSAFCDRESLMEDSDALEFGSLERRARVIAYSKSSPTPRVPPPQRDMHAITAVSCRAQIAPWPFFARARRRDEPNV